MVSDETNSTMQIPEKWDCYRCGRTFESTPEESHTPVKWEIAVAIGGTEIGRGWVCRACDTLAKRAG